MGSQGDIKKSMEFKVLRVSTISTDSYSWIILGTNPLSCPQPQQYLLFPRHSDEVHEITPHIIGEKALALGSSMYRYFPRLIRKKARIRTQIFYHPAWLSFHWREQYLNTSSSPFSTFRMEECKMLPFSIKNVCLSMENFILYPT